MTSGSPSRAATLHNLMTARQATTEPDPLYTEKEAARYLRVSVRTLRRWRETGSGPSVIVYPDSRVVRYRRVDLAEYVLLGMR